MKSVHLIHFWVHARIDTVFEFMPGLTLVFCQLPINANCPKGICSKRSIVHGCSTYLFDSPCSHVSCMYKSNKPMTSGDFFCGSLTWYVNICHPSYSQIQRSSRLGHNLAFLLESLSKIHHIRHVPTQGSKLSKGLSASYSRNLHTSEALASLASHAHFQSACRHEQMKTSSSLPIPYPAYKQYTQMYQHALYMSAQSDRLLA